MNESDKVGLSTKRIRKRLKRSSAASPVTISRCKPVSHKFDYLLLNSHHIRCIMAAGWLLENLSETVYNARKTLQNVAETFKTKARPIIRGAVTHRTGSVQ